MITLASDFGSPYPAAMKGVLLERTDSATRLVDLTHELPRGDVRSSAFWLREILPYVPPAIHLVVVDPGVGTDRRAIVVNAGDHRLVGPDNGVLLPVARRLVGNAEQHSDIESADDPAADVEAYVVDESALETPVPTGGKAEAAGSTTFHGRDVFAPIAAALEETSQSLETLPWLSPLSEPIDCRLPTAATDGDTADATVLAVDDFGNVITNVPGRFLEGVDRVLVDDERVPVGETFASVERGEPVALVGSHGYVELDVNDGRGSEAFGLFVDEHVTLERLESP
ncbi:S-adenosyl-l-methionine hydroxide adenosyltransferase family protein [Natrialbaceae archaeon A-CW2]|uniref:SAM hydrolase/SAM-dependent halogenase family protein n=1 Tax=Natronosalvus amylolyticus TaxID=2961994 RepID=UPI0020C998C9|nr:SAM-dependent chlorinase/fluorinase [Natronosalvus amylolyticus]